MRILAIFKIGLLLTHLLEFFTDVILCITRVNYNRKIELPRNQDLSLQHFFLLSAASVESMHPQTAYKWLVTASCCFPTLGCIHNDMCAGYWLFIRVKPIRVECSRSLIQTLVTQTPLKMWRKLWNTFNFLQKSSTLSPVVLYIAVDDKIVSYLYWCINK